MALHDGKQSFVGVELDPLPWSNIVPGSKVVLLPGCLIRRGRMLLTPSKVRFLGSPRESIWGTAHSKLVDDALVKAGLPKRTQSTFDSIVDMGGIADLDQEEEDGEEGFWREVADVADRMEVQLPGSNQARASAPASTPATVPIPEHGPGSNHRNSSVLERRATSNGVPESVNVSGDPLRQQDQVDIVNEPIEIPDMPILDPESEMISSIVDEDTTTADDNPLCYLNNNSPFGLLRCYAPKTLRKVSIQKSGNHTSLRTFH